MTNCCKRPIRDKCTYVHLRTAKSSTTRVVQTCAIQSTRVKLLPVSRSLKQPSRYCILKFLLNWHTRCLQTILKKNLTSDLNVKERFTQVLDKEECVKEQVNFEPLCVS